jgi:carbonic anhydrase/acetyltransferase-like protein (isoleucine patch superfamily)
VISGGCTIEPNCFLGVNATLRDHVRIGRESLIGMGAACIVKDTAPRSVYKGIATKPADVTSDQIKI